MGFLNGCSTFDQGFEGVVMSGRDCQTFAQWCDCLGKSGRQGIFGVCGKANFINSQNHHFYGCYEVAVHGRFMVSLASRMGFWQGPPKSMVCAWPVILLVVWALPLRTGDGAYLSCEGGPGRTRRCTVAMAWLAMAGARSWFGSQTLFPWNEPAGPGPINGWRKSFGSNRSFIPVVGRNR